MNGPLPSDAPLPAPPERKPGRRTWRHLGMVLLIFLGGAACGAAAATFVLKRALHHAMQNPSAMSTHITGRLAAMLDLTDEQAKQVREIILRHHDGLIDIRRDIQPRLEAELGVLEEEIAALLSEEQRARWHAHAAAMRAHWLPPIPESSTR